jgi:hypothetical protein
MLRNSTGYLPAANPFMPLTLASGAAARGTVAAPAVAPGAICPTPASSSGAFSASVSVTYTVSYSVSYSSERDQGKRSLGQGIARAKVGPEDLKDNSDGVARPGAGPGLRKIMFATGTRVHQPLCA